MKSSASSHVAGTSSPCLRKSGVVRRAGEYWSSRYWLVRRHRNPCVMGWRLSPWSLTTRPSSTVATIPHASGQSRLHSVVFCTHHHCSVVLALLPELTLSLIHISEPTRLLSISYA